MNLMNELIKRLNPVKITALYMVLGIFLITVTDILLNRITGNIEPVITAGILNHTLFVALTALLLYILLKKHLQALAKVAHAEQLLQESEERFHTIFDESPIPMVLNETVGGTYVDVNKQFLKHAAVSREEAIGRTALELGTVEPDETERLNKMLRDYGRLDQEEIVSRDKNGEQRTAILSTRKITISGTPFVISMLQDITDRKRYENKLARSEANYRNLFENAPVGVFQSTFEGRYVSVNKEFSSIFGYQSPHDVLERITNIGTQVYAHQEDRLQMLRQVLVSDNVACDEFEFLRKDGTPLFATLYMRAVRNDGGNPDMLEGFVVDTTERKRVFNALREREERLRLYIQRLPLPCIVFVNGWIIKSWNPAAEVVFGYSEQEALDRSANDLIIPPHEHARVDGIFQQILAGTDSKNTVGENITKDGRTIVCEWTNTLLCDNSGHISGIISIAQDITEKMQACELLVQHEKMIMIGGLAAGMAHEINNPLSTIIQSAYMIEQRLNQGNHMNRDVAESVGVDLDLVCEYLKRREIFDFIAGISSSGGRAAKIVSNMLTFSRKGNSGHRPAEINQVIEHAIEMVASDYDIKRCCNFRNIEIVRNYAEGLPEVAVDATEIEQVLINLLKNAVMAFAENDPPGKPVVRVTTCRDNNNLLIKVADNGSGMSKEISQRIFEPFFTTKEVGSGTGLGLYVSYLIITNNHHGQIVVDSKSGEGTVFVISLPLS